MSRLLFTQVLACPADAICILADDFQLALVVTIVVPVALDLLLYGVFITLFGISIHIFKRKYKPGRLYIVAILLFFGLSTTSVVLDIFFRVAAASSGQPDLPLASFNFRQAKIENIAMALDYICVAAGVLGDIILTHRCYRLWNSRKWVIVLPVLGLLGVIAAWMGFMISRPASIAIVWTDEILVGIELVENIILTGMIAGRLWWMNKRVDQILPGGDQPGQQNLAGIILESALIVPMMLLLAIPAVAYGNQPKVNLSFLVYAYIILNPCIWTQTVAIASMLIVIRIGLGVNDPGADTPDLDIAEHDMRKEGEKKVYDQAIQPFRLKYVQYHDHRQHPDSSLPSREDNATLGSS
ncbi:hypothetical protein GYMLUDRAFT_76610 [Collybiopsis luxurians FD-317 M1]|uniref:Uncharacterized protein n=1 Tax=Collybiopsis luxurians FD-317 M1 TaxID=944289 RepID=A0A0D0AX73_9AGAR|nr:hypothetical protein GYMLUDRAFT_76610 [Collybiopsis luxurians FD-317 M1]